VTWDAKTQIHWMYRQDRDKSIAEHLTKCRGPVSAEWLFKESIALRCYECDANWPHVRERHLRAVEGDRQ
jgi:hypothetical protein